MPSSRQQHGAAFARLEVFGAENAVVDQRKHEAVGHARPQFLHQIQRQRGAARPVAVQKADVGVQPHAFQRRRAVVARAGCTRRTTSALNGSSGGRRLRSRKKKQSLALRIISSSTPKYGRRALPLQAAQTLQLYFRGDLTAEATAMCRRRRRAPLRPRAARGRGGYARCSSARCRACRRSYSARGGSFAAGSSAARYWLRRSRTLPPPSPPTRARKRPPGVAERQTDAALGARAHQRRRSARIGKGEDAGQRVQRIARGLLSVPTGDDVLAVERQIRVFSEVTNSVLSSCSHGSLSPPIASAR